MRARPSEAQLCEQHGVARGTVRAAPAAFVGEGVAEVVPGVGSSGHRAGPDDGVRSHAKDLAEQIRAGTLAPGTAFPNDATVMEQYDVSRNTSCCPGVTASCRTSRARCRAGRRSDRARRGHVPVGAARRRPGPGRDRQDRELRRAGRTAARPGAVRADGGVTGRVARGSGGAVAGTRSGRPRDRRARHHRFRRRSGIVDLDSLPSWRGGRRSRQRSRART